MKSAKSPAGRVASTAKAASGLPSKQTLAAFLGKAQHAVRLRGEVTVLLTTDLTIRDLNGRFRGKKKPTDVLSFPASPARGPEKIAGDLAISVDTARKQAAERGHSLAIELKILVLHGLLHLAGHDHETDQGEMDARERKLRNKLGLPEGLIERTSPGRESRPKVRGTASARPTAGGRRTAGGGAR